MKIRYFIFLFSLMVLSAGVSFANTAIDPMIIFGNSPAGMALSACTFPNTCSTGLDATGSTPAEGQPGNLTFFNDTMATYDSFTVTVDTPFTGALSCSLTSDALSTFNTATPSGNSCIFSEVVLFSIASITPGATFDLQYLDFTGLTSLTYGFAPVPEPSTFVLLGTGLAAALLVGRKRMRGAKPTWAS